MDIYEQDFEVNEKSPNHPITKADIDSHLIIKESLENLLPGTHFFSDTYQQHLDAIDIYIKKDLKKTKAKKHD